MRRLLDPGGPWAPVAARRRPQVLKLSSRARWCPPRSTARGEPGGKDGSSRTCNHLQPGGRFHACGLWCDSG